MNNPSQDQWVDVKQPAQSDNEWQDVRQPADANLQSKADNDFASQHPYLKTLQDTTNQAIVNPVIKFANGVAPALRGVNKMVGGPGEGQNIPSPDMSNAPLSSKVLGNISGGVGYTLGAAAISRNPVAGMAGMGALSSVGNGQDAASGAINGIGQGALMWGAGVIGSKASQYIAKPLSQAVSNISSNASNWIMKYAPNLGTALGMSGAGAIMSPEGQKVEGATTGATMGLMNPISGNKYITSGEYNNDYLPKAGEQIVRVLNPGKNVYNNFSNSGNDVDEAAQTLAHNRIIIGKTSDGRIDNNDGMQQLLNSTKPYAQQLQQMLGTNKSTIPGQGGFDLEDLRKQALDSVQNHPDFQDAVSRNAARNQINKFIDAEIEEPGRGRYVNGQTLDDIKGGWWKVRYDQNNAAAKPVGGMLGNIAKTTLENAYPDHPISDVNAAQGKLLNAYHLLDMTNGNKITGEGMGNHILGVAGAVAGHGVGSLLPIPGVSEIVGSGVGFGVGEMGGKYLNDPTRITTNIAKKLDNLKIVNPSGLGEGESARKGAVTPELMNQRNIPTPQDLGISMNPVAGLLPQGNAGRNGSLNTQPINMGTDMYKQGMPINQPANPGALGIGQSWQGSKNPVPQKYPNMHPIVPMGNPSMSKLNPINNDTMQGSMNFVKGLTPEQLKAAEKAVKIEKIIRS